MNDTDEPKVQPPKPSRLAGLIAPKGAAARPGEVASPPAAAAVEAAPAQPKERQEKHVDPAPVQVPRTAPPSPPPPPPPTGTGSKSLTLRLPDAEYERLRARAYTSRMSHQAILAEALRRYLDDEGMQ